MALPVKVMMVETSSFSRCEMCSDTKVGPRWIFRFAQMVSDYIAEELKICRKCVYRETYGTKTMNKAKKYKLLDKLNHEFNSIPSIEDY